MADYHQIKNAAILMPTTGTDLGSTNNPYSNVYLSGNIAMSNGVVINPSTVTSPKITSVTYPGVETAVLAAGGETVTITGTGFSNTGGTPQVFIGTTVAPVVTYISSTSLTFATPALSLGVYSLYIVNNDSGVGIYAPGINYSGTPTWTTSAGSLGSTPQGSSPSFTVLATSDSVVTYSVKAGSSLPAGLSLNSSTGAITGTAPSPASQTTYTFTLTATDTENQTTDRSFSITVLISVMVDYLVVAGGGAGGNGQTNLNNGGGGGAGGLLTDTGLVCDAGVTYTVTIGAGGAANTSGSNSVFSSITTIGGGRAGGGLGSYSAQNGGSGGGGAAGGQTTGGKGVYPGSSYLSQARQGYDGGNNRGSAPGHGGGGGGAGGAGASTGGEGDGGIGVSSSITGTATYYAGGGGAGADGNQGSGGLGGGGDGVWYDQGRGGFPGTVNTGGGGGGGASRPASELGGAGGSGVVIIRYADSEAAATSTTGSPTYTVAGGYRIYKFTASGSITL